MNALARFVGRGPLSFADIRRLDAGEFDLLLAWLDEVLSMPRDPDGSRQATTADGRLAISLRDPPSVHDRCFIDTPLGRLHSLNYRICIEETGAWAMAPGVGGES